MAESKRPKAGGGAAGGPRAVLSALGSALREMGPGGSARALLQLNQPKGFTCPGCAWPDPAERSTLEFCEAGARHVAHEATRRRAGPDLFAEFSIAQLSEQSDQWLEARGRLTEPLVRRAGSDRYQPLSFDEAFERIGTHLRGLSDPGRAVFYTSGRTSNEAAFLWQLLARELGTNNLPDCSNLCHESSSVALKEAIGIGKGTVSLEDFEHANAIFVIGHNPGSNHPRMLTSLLRAKRNGAAIVAVNPLRERALVRFAHPKDPLAWVRGGQAIADLYLQVRIGGDVALLKGMMKSVLESERRAPGTALDRAFLERHTEGFDPFRAALERVRWDEIVEESGLTREEIQQAARIYLGARRTIVCWCMGLTQHAHGVANVQEIMNLLLLRGNVGIEGAGPCPVRGHSNVQGDRTMGITSHPDPDFLEALSAEFGIEPPAGDGLDTVGAIRAMHEGRVDVFLGLGGNFATAAPDTEYTHEALRRCRLTVHVATTLNRSHLVTGEEAILLPCLARSELDVQAGGPQFVTVEDSMSCVHASHGSLRPASEHLKSEPAIVAGIARAALGGHTRVPWAELVGSYDLIRERIARVIPGCEDMNLRVREPGGFVLASGARTRAFDTPSGRARFTVHDLPRRPTGRGRLVLMAIRSHDQFNTTVYSQGDRYRGIQGDRRVILMNPEDAALRGLRADERVDVTSHFDGETRTVRGFRVVPYDLPRRCAAAYFPEANPLVPVDSVADRSRTPTYKSIVVSVAPSVDREEQE